MLQKYVTDCPEHPDEMVLSNASSMGNKAANEMDRVTMEEEYIHEFGEEEKGKLNYVDYLTGNPMPNDALLYAIPVCGPYSSVQSDHINMGYAICTLNFYTMDKYCVKIIP
ncbi:unnamed protein product [Fraxinus pennsylvanica]|uniref:NFACT protein C-terminal domain-containing protein n=1 Tax=Fraxinus pennsylvanica TaxID=56036 RepID=A0AAD1Z8Q8_9LAMI|nr:unnamed protein product [Fraxinus pennsylvanica]